MSCIKPLTAATPIKDERTSESEIVKLHSENGVDGRPIISKTIFQRSNQSHPLLKSTGLQVARTAISALVRVKAFLIVIACLTTMLTIIPAACLTGRLVCTLAIMAIKIVRHRAFLPCLLCALLAHSIPFGEVLPVRHIHFAAGGRNRKSKGKQPLDATQAQKTSGPVLDPTPPLGHLSWQAGNRKFELQYVDWDTERACGMNAIKYCTGVPWEKLDACAHVAGVDPTKGSHTFYELSKIMNKLRLCINCYMVIGRSEGTHPALEPIECKLGTGSMVNAPDRLVFFEASAETMLKFGARSSVAPNWGRESHVVVAVRRGLTIRTIQGPMGTPGPSPSGPPDDPSTRPTHPTSGPSSSATLPASAAPHSPQTTTTAPPAAVSTPPAQAPPVMPITSAAPAALVTCPAPPPPPHRPAFLPPTGGKRVTPDECPYLEQPDGKIMQIREISHKSLERMFGNHRVVLSIPVAGVETVSYITWAAIAISILRKLVWLYVVLRDARVYERLWDKLVQVLMDMRPALLGAAFGDDIGGTLEWMLDNVEYALTVLPYVSILATHIIPFAWAYAWYKFSLFRSTHFPNGFPVLVINCTVRLGEFSVGLGDRQWWYTGSPNQYIGCGPTRPDTLYNVPRSSAWSMYKGRCEHTVFSPVDRPDLMCDTGLENCLRTTKLCWWPIQVTEGAHTWVYSFVSTGRKAWYEGGEWEEYRAVRSMADGVDHARFTEHCRRSERAVKVQVPSGISTTTYMQVPSAPTMMLPLKTYLNAARVSFHSANKAAVVESLRNVITTHSASSPDFVAEPEAILAWTGYFLEHYHQARLFGDVKFAAKKSKGDALPATEEQPLSAAPRRCNVCRGWAPIKYSWRHGMCPRCYVTYTRQWNDGYESLLYADGETQYPRDPGIKHMPGIVFMEPCRAVEKTKPPRSGAVFGGTIEEVAKAKLGFTDGTILRPDKQSKPALVGIGLATRVSVFQNNPEVEDVALRTRLFANPLMSTTKPDYEGLFAFMDRMGLIGQKQDEMPKLVFSNTSDWPEPEERRVDFADRLRKFADDCNYIVDGDGTHRGWIADFPPARRAQFWKAIQADPLEKVRFNFFIKRELAVLPPRWGVEAPDQTNPRIICSPNDQTHCVMGPAMRYCTHFLHSLWGHGSWLTYAGGLTPPEMADWLQQEVSPDCMHFTRGSGFVAVENDFSKFDCTYSATTLDFVRRVYAHWGFDVTKGPMDLVWRGWRRPKGYTKSGRVVCGPVMNASGRDDTALMNALINGGVQAYAYASVLLGTNRPENASSEELEWVRNNVRLVVLGDDSLAIVPERDLHGRLWKASDISRVVDIFGFEARDMKVHHHPCKAVFLGCRPYPALDRGILVASWGPTIGRRAVRLAFFRDPAGKDPYAWLKGITTAALQCYGHVPYLNDLARRMHELNPSRQTTPNDWKEDAHKRFMFQSDLEEANEVWPCLEMVYGVSRWDRALFRARLNQIIALPAVVIDPKLESMVEADT